VLLTIAVISTSLFVFNWLFTSVNEAYVTDMLLSCNESIFVPQSPSVNPRAQLDESAKAAQIASECVEPMEQQQAAWTLVGIASLLAVTFILYWLTPTILIRRQRLQRLADEDGPEMLAYVTHQCEVMGLAERPAVYWNPTNLSMSGQAFGRVGRRCLALTGGLLVQFHVDPAAAQAVVLHELSHFKNQDVDKTYLATAAWYAFVIVALVPFGLTLIDYLQRSAFEIVFGFGWRLGALALFVFAMRNAILRAREPYADVRATSFAKTTGGLQRVLAAAPPESSNKLRALLSLHPPATFRQRVLSDTRPLFLLNSGDALAAGVAASIASVSTIYRIAEILPSHLEWLANWVYWLVVAPFAIGILALGLWRTAFAQVASGITERRPVGRIGVAFGLGLIAGLVLEPQTAVVGVGSFTTWTVDPLFAIFQIVWCAVVVISCWLFVHWIRRSANVWLAAREWTLNQTRIIVSVGVVLAIVLMLALFSALMTVASDGGMSIFALLLSMFLTGRCSVADPCFGVHLALMR
jgi:Zn-dependent protease with chaperone function